MKLLVALIVLAGTLSADDPPVRSRRVLMFVGDQCRVCRVAIAELEEWMRPSDWTFGPTADNHVQYVNCDKEPDLMQRFKIDHEPTFVLLVDGVERRRVVGYQMSQPLEQRRRVIVDLYTADFKQ